VLLDADWLHLKNMKKYIIIILLFLAIGKCYAQPSDSFRIGKIEIYERFSKVLWSRGSTFFGIFNYKGTLERGIHDLWHTTRPYVRYNKKPPLKYLEYKASNGDEKLSKAYIKTCLQAHFGFKVSEMKDSCEVWILHILDTAKLNQHSFVYDRDWMKYYDGDDYWVNYGADIRFVLQTILENERGQMAIQADENNDSYNFKIPNKVIDSFDSLDAFLRENYGLGFTKEKRLVDLIYVNFD
jgi:hypothetical protein